ncbi:hypothetical protein EVAR_15906_1 [Eumeta japonica]|uniref:Uncharacterized protein n=1 Tax=Eumeta variegata TaxID=151549 RepID=A0A4C1UEE5_EUMVA|nr:hypothetical protein EVAR_15906_1 [Eumeta japonica]
MLGGGVALHIIRHAQCRARGRELARSKASQWGLLFVFVGSPRLIVPLRRYVVSVDLNMGIINGEYAPEPDKG